ncbi:uncharacterized protein LTR77_006368 [Saxophila tyrrhenica]|uniref:KAR9-domain-containing protein n=1 Tax=Saxophila tyrrhenica TaxID=1690608 RepID=A0AAV9PB52_9PEZI|nr:hypothetical protein LTR77_006368 [Saxophila tyrrhenica]
MPSGGVRLSGGPVLSEAEVSFPESDASSIISISDRFAPSDTEEENGLHDKQKYRLLEPGNKTRLNLRTKEPLPPNPRSVPPSPPRKQTNTSAPSTPRTMRSSTQQQSPLRASHRPTNGSSENVSDSDFASSGLSRAGSIYTLGRASLQGQLAHLTSLRLPDASSLAKKISDIPSSTDAAKALSDASDQIRLWIAKATDVLNGLNAEDDVEWAAAGGREGIEDVDAAITRFQRLIDVYLISIEELQTRKDVSELPADELRATVKQMEGILSSWQKVKSTLGGVKGQVEVALEWEELWNTVLGEIGQEMDGLNRLVFEMEEKRHEGTGSLLSSRDSIDLHELETIIEERPGKGAPLNNHRLSLPTFSPSSPNESREDSSLLALFARMQPLRASLDFLPMRLATFQIRGHPIFPSACEDLHQRREHLEEEWKRLESDAESLRRELGEDRWILVFRNAGRQALKMEESITRSFNKLKDAVAEGEQQNDGPSFTKKAENYEAKKTHYGPAIERVLAIIDRGVQDRLTVNGEILRLQIDMKARWTALQAEMQDMDSVLEEICSETRDKQLRDSVSTVMSSERSLASSLMETPGSSPASSVAGTSRKSSFHGSRTPTPLNVPKARKPSSGRAGPSSIPRRIPLTQSRDSTPSPYSSPLAARSIGNISISTTKTDLPVSNRPRWHQAMKAESRDFRPLSAFEPSPYAKGPVVKQTNFLRASSAQTPAPSSSRLPQSRMTPSRNFSTPNPPRTQSRLPATVPRVTSVNDTGRKSCLPVPVSTLPQPRPSATRAASALASCTPPSRLKTPSSVPHSRRRSLLSQPPLPLNDGNEADNESPLHHKVRPPSALSSGRRSSMLPMRGKGTATAAGAQDERPKWR